MCLYKKRPSQALNETIGPKNHPFKVVSQTGKKNHVIFVLIRNAELCTDVSSPLYLIDFVFVPTNVQLF